MQYMGGKSRIARQLAAAMSPKIGGGALTFVSLFCGSCAVESKITGFDRMILNDRHPYLIALMQAAQDGWEPPETVTEEQYRFIKDNPEEVPAALTGFVGFGCSFGGKWFGGYARDAKGLNYAAISKRSLLKDTAALRTALYTCLDYRAVSIPAGAVVYADPPYEGTTGYTGEKFDNDEFWDYARLIAETGHTIFVSEQQAPPGWRCVWEKPFTRTLDKNRRFTVTEKLFTYGGADLCS